MAGKFASVNDEAVYAQTLDGTGETVGDVQTIGAVWTRVTIPESFDWEVPFTSITRVRAGTYIIEEDSQGFVTVVGYDTEGPQADPEDIAKLAIDWERIQQEVAQFEEDDTEQ